MPQRSRGHPGQGSGTPRYPGTFLLAFREATAKLNWQVRKWHGSHVECLDAEGREHVVGLENLYRRARRHDRANWPTVITEFLTAVSTGDAVETMPDDLAEVADRLLVRLGTPLKSMPTDAKVWDRPLDATGLCINLVIDFANRMFYVTEKLVADSDRPGEEWLERAVANLLQRSPADCFQPIHEESDMLLCSVGDAYDSSRALLLGALLPETAALGCFVTLASRDELMVLPVSTEAQEQVHMLRVLAEKTFPTAPYPISAEVFWVHEGIWRLFPIEIKGQEVNIRPPAEFVPLLGQLAPPEDDQPT